MPVVESLQISCWSSSISVVDEQVDGGGGEKRAAKGALKGENIALEYNL